MRPVEGFPRGISSPETSSVTTTRVTAHIVRSLPPPPDSLLMHLPLPRSSRKSFLVLSPARWSSLTARGLIASSPRCRCGCRNSSVCSCSCCVHPLSVSTSAPVPQSKAFSSSSLSAVSCCSSPRIPSRHIPSWVSVSARTLSSTTSRTQPPSQPTTMAQEYKLKDISSLADLKNLDKAEYEVEGVQDGKVLLVKYDGQVHAMSPRCTHYGAPLKNGVVAPDGRLTCPWHGACFNITSGDVEDAPAPNALAKFDVVEKNDAVYIKGEESAIKSGQRDPSIKCSATSEEKVVVVGGGSGTLGVVQSLREMKFTGAITVISREPNLVIDRPKLSKALIPDAKKIEIRPREWYDNASINLVSDEVTAVDFPNKTVTTKSCQSVPYTKLVLATGGVPRTLPLDGFKDLSNIFTLRSVPDVQNILAAVGDDKNKNIVVIGSSFIGMEVGNALAKDNHVTIVGMESTPMERVMGVDVGRIVQRNLESAGVTFKLSAGVEKATASSSNPSHVGAVHLNDGTVLPADLVILGVGVRPATDFLANNPAITLEKDGSLRTDENFLVPGLDNTVHAIGDIATYPYHGPGADGTPTRIEHWNVAQNAGRAVARFIVNTNTKHTPRAKPFIPIFWSAVGGQLRYCGNTPNGWDDLVLQGEPEKAKFAAYYCKGETVVAVATMGMDPIMVQCAELMRRGNMPSKTQIRGGVDVLKVGVPEAVKM